MLQTAEHIQRKFIFHFYSDSDMFLTEGKLVSMNLTIQKLWGTCIFI